MKVRVIQPFCDKYTKVIYQRGQEIDVTAERFKEILSRGRLVEEIEQVSDGEPVKKVQGKKSSTAKGKK